MSTCDVTSLSPRRRRWLRVVAQSGMTAGVLASNSLCLAGGDPGQTDILRWKDGRTGAISLTYDDNRPDHICFAWPAMQARGLVGTFNVIAGESYFEWNKAAFTTMAQQGNEMGDHTLHHQRCLIVPPEQDPTNAYFHSLEQLDQDCRTAVSILSPLGPTHFVPTFCYPGGVQSAETRAVIATHFLSARLSNVGLHVNPPNPPDMYMLAASYVGNGWEPGWDDYAYADGMLDSFLNGALNQAGWVIEEYHDLEWPGYSALNLDAYYDHLDDLQAAVTAGSLWVAPQGVVTRYIYSRKAASITVLSSQPDKITLVIDDGLDGQLFDVPLTVRTKIPPAWGSSVRVKHAGANVSCKLEPRGPDSYLIYSVPADGLLTEISQLKAKTPLDQIPRP